MWETHNLPQNFSRKKKKRRCFAIVDMQQTDSSVQTVLGRPLWFWKDWDTKGTSLCFFSLSQTDSYNLTPVSQRGYRLSGAFCPILWKKAPLDQQLGFINHSPRSPLGQFRLQLRLEVGGATERLRLYLHKMHFLFLIFMMMEFPHCRLQIAFVSFMYCLSLSLDLCYRLRLDFPLHPGGTVMFYIAK